MEEERSKPSTKRAEPPREDFSRVVANLTHELKTPLHSILAVASVLESEVDGPLTDEQRRQVGIITRNGEHLLELITGLLQFSSTTTETRRLNLRRLNVRTLFDDLIRSIQPVAARRGVAVDSDLERLQPYFCTDKTLLHRIFGNLLSNAVKFSPDGGSVSFFAETRKDGSLHAEVSDTGIGMPPEVLTSIFSEFYQVESSDSRRFGGVGLGLSLVQRAVQLLGGALEVKSEPGQGTLFSITIPAAEESAEKRRVLILDQDPVIQLTLTECFRIEGYDACIAPSAAELVRQISELRPDLVMIDLNGPDLPELALVREIRSASWGKDLPILLMSVLDAPAERARSFEAGASDFIVKPFDVAELLARVRSQLERPW